jgi:hypothetical protein
VGGFFALVVAVMVLGRTGDGSSPTSPSQTPASTPAAASIDVDAKIAKRCAERESILADVKKHINAGEPWKAHIAVRPCANQMPTDEQYLALSKQTEVADYLLTITSTSAKPDERLRAYRKLSEVDPKSAAPYATEFKRVEEKEAIAALSRWRTNVSADTLTGKKTTTHSVESDNQVSLDFPYRGPQRATLFVRKHPKSGLNIAISIERGQLLCHDSSLDYGRCMIDVRFDEKPPRRVQMGKSDSGDSTILFVTNEGPFYKELLNSKSLIMQPTIYKHGAAPFTFQTIALPNENTAK